MTGIAIGISAVISLIAIANGILFAVQSVLENLPGDVLVVMPNSIGLETSNIPEDLAEQVAALDGAEGVEPFIFRLQGFDVSSILLAAGTPADDSEATASQPQTRPAASSPLLATVREQLELDSGVSGLPIWGVKPDGRLVEQFTIVDGDGFAPIDPNDPASGRQVLIGSQLADRLRRALRVFRPKVQDLLDNTPAFFWTVNGIGRAQLDHLREFAAAEGLPRVLEVRPGERWHLRGTFRTGGLMDISFAIPYETMQDFASLEERASVFLVQSGAGVTPEELIERINQVAPDKILAVVPEEYLANFGADINSIRSLVFAIGFIAALAGAVGVLNTMMSNVHERTREIGLLLAVGWHPSHVMRAILIEGFLLSLIGGVLAIPIALIQVESAAYFIQFDPTPHGIDGSVYALGIGLSLALGLLGSLLPAFRAARLRPVEALREA